MPAVPVILLYAIVAAGLLAVGAAKSSRRILAVVNLLFWLASAASAVAVWWAWRDRGMGENWAMLGVVFFSFPILLVTLVLATAALVAMRMKKMAGTGSQKLSLCLLLVFLVLQGIAGVLAGMPK